MKILIVAGGSGKRFWPISREKFPKIFIPLINNTSTFQLQVKRAKEIVGIENVYVSTNEKYVSLIKQQAPNLPTANIFAEPKRKDLLAAVGFALIKFRKLGISEPILYLASDHLIKREDQLKKGVKAAEQLINENPDRFVFFGEKPLYPTNNLGWINIGKEVNNINDISVVEYKDWIYRPDMKECKKMFKTGKWLWNVNYEMFTVEFALKIFEENFPKTYEKLTKIEKNLDTDSESVTVNKIYPELEEAHSDDLWASAKKDQAVVLNLNIGWSDPGTLYLLKKTLEKSPSDNVTKGNIFAYKSKDCLIYNYDESKLVTAMNLDGMIVVNTKDALLVVDKEHVRYLRDMLDKFKDTQFEEYL